jgi:hypothetical protein
MAIYGVRRPLASCDRPHPESYFVVLNAAEADKYANGSYETHTEVTTIDNHAGRQWLCDRAADVRRAGGVVHLVGDDGEFLAHYASPDSPYKDWVRYAPHAKVISRAIPSGTAAYVGPACSLGDCWIDPWDQDEYETVRHVIYRDYNGRVVRDLLFTLETDKGEWEQLGRRFTPRTPAKPDVPVHIHDVYSPDELIF